MPPARYLRAQPAGWLKTWRWTLTTTTARRARCYRRGFPLSTAVFSGICPGSRIHSDPKNPWTQHLKEGVRTLQVSSLRFLGESFHLFKTDFKKQSGAGGEWSGGVLRGFLDAKLLIRLKNPECPRTLIPLSETRQVGPGLQPPRFILPQLRPAPAASILRPDESRWSHKGQVKRG